MFIFIKSIYALISKRAFFNIVISVLLAISGFVINEKLADILELQQDNKKIIELITVCKTKIDVLEQDNVYFKTHILNHLDTKLK